MKRVQQKHRLGCFNACIAMITGLSYEKALKLVHPKRRKGEYTETHLPEVVVALIKINADYKLTFDKNIKNIKNPAIVIVKWKNGSSHAVVWDPELKKILDPWKPISKLNDYKKYFLYAIEIKSLKLS